VDGRATARTTSYGWAPTFQLPASNASPVAAQLVIHQFPFAGLLAGFTLLLWFLVWLGFGSIQSLEWLFARRRRASAPRHAKRGAHG